MPRRQWSIRAWLRSLVAAVALPLLLLLIWIFAAQLQRDLEEARDSALRIAKISAGRIGAQHASSAALLAQMAQRPAVREFAGGPCDALFGLVNLFPQWADLMLYDREGKLVCSAMPSGEDAAISRIAQQSIATEAVGLSQPVVRRILGHWIAIVRQPVTGGDGAHRGVLILLQRLDFNPSEALVPNTVVTILDRDGTVIARSSGWAGMVGRSAGGAEAATIAFREREGRAAARGLDGVSRQYGFTQIPKLGWTVYAGIPTSDVMRSVRQTILLGVGGGALIVLIIAVAARRVARGIERPVAALVTAVESDMENGYGRAAAAGGPLETARLSAAFNGMVERRSAAERRTLESERNLKALSERLLMVQEQERMRVAREIHDDLGQALTALKMDVIGLLEKSRHSPDAAPMVARILATIDSTVTAVQRISSELRPSVLDDLGLFAAIEAEAQLFEERTGIECELSLPAEPLDLEKATATAIYRILQEALTNVARHSGAARVEIRVRERTDELLLEIRDDGRGIAPREVAGATSFGLIGIRERADMLGGTALIEGVAGRGTIVSIRIPREQGSHT